MYCYLGQLTQKFHFLFQWIYFSSRFWKKKKQQQRIWLQTHGLLQAWQFFFSMQELTKFKKLPSKKAESQHKQINHRFNNGQRDRANEKRKLIFDRIFLALCYCLWVSLWFVFLILSSSSSSFAKAKLTGNQIQKTHDWCISQCECETMRLMVFYLVGVLFCIDFNASTSRNDDLASAQLRLSSDIVNTAWWKTRNEHNCFESLVWINNHVKIVKMIWQKKSYTTQHVLGHTPHRSHPSPDPSHIGLSWFCHIT